MSTDEMDAFRAELLRQKIIFEAELRRQRETFEERLSRLSQELADREADCRNLQAVVTILGKKVDALMERRVGTPQRRPSPAKNGERGGDEARETAAGRSAPPLRVPSPSARRSSPFRRHANTATGTAPSLSSFGSRQNSPARTGSINGQRPRIATDGTPDHVARRSSAHRLQKVKSTDEW